jgi:isopentenyl-diphosphate Delta-isomerase
MKTDQKPSHSDNLAERKGDHIVLAEKARTASSLADERFNYEPMFFAHPKIEEKWQTNFLSFELDYPIWVSSMTGGTRHARTINENLARLCGEFKLGMGLGSCRGLLADHTHIKDFSVKKFLGPQPLFANLGIAQLEELVLEKKTNLVHELVRNIECDGLIIHINPLQEWFQPEGDRFKNPPIEIIKRFLDDVRYPVIVKEVGQGMGPRSLKALLELPIAGVEFGAFGGTNFTLLEKLRGKANEGREAFIHVGHSAREMVGFLNALPTRKKEFIISGGISTMLDGFELKSKLKANSVIGMASAFLEPALADYDTLKDFFLRQREALLVAKSLLESKEEV